MLRGQTGSITTSGNSRRTQAPSEGSCQYQGSVTIQERESVWPSRKDRNLDVQASNFLILTFFFFNVNICLQARRVGRDGCGLRASPRRWGSCQVLNGEWNLDLLICVYHVDTSWEVVWLGGYGLGVWFLICKIRKMKSVRRAIVRIKWDQAR